MPHALHLAGPAAWGRLNRRPSSLCAPLLPGRPLTAAARQQPHQNQLVHSHSHPTRNVATAAAAAASPQPEQPPLPASLRLTQWADGVVADLRGYGARFTGLWGSFLPMVSLFFLLSFINTILDTMKDTLVITAVGGGAHVIPFLSVRAAVAGSGRQ